MASQRHLLGVVRRRAFSLAELLVAVAILAILAAIALPRYHSALDNYRLSAAAQRVAADLNLARESARTASQSRTASFKVAQGYYEIPNLRDETRRSETYTIDLARDPFVARIESAGFGGDADVVFDGFGAPDSGGTVVLRVGSRTMSVVVDAATGKATVQ
jgi:prepilin-type N-terminal cleavage/methylation domain-containing protein